MGILKNSILVFIWLNLWLKKFFCTFSCLDALLFIYFSLKFSTRITWCFPRIQTILSSLNQGFLSCNPAMFYVEFLSYCPSFPLHSLPVTIHVHLCGPVPWISFLLCHVHSHFLFCVRMLVFEGMSGNVKC